MKYICAKKETRELINRLRAEKTGNIRIAVLTDNDYAKNNGYQDEITGIDMDTHDVVILNPDV